uniref:Uncharacterized protein n=1 Tax=Gossypium raimondii TaxID=29730 RepID=A0A0D2TYH1_GOSRA|nr:hypothetical protein B456_009G321000 [Gossypium raimondii]
MKNGCFSSSSNLYYLHYNPKKKTDYNRTKDVEQKAPSFLYNGKWWVLTSTADHVLQVARCFLPHRFKRSFTITFL